MRTYTMQQLRSCIGSSTCRIIICYCCAPPEQRCKPVQGNVQTDMSTIRCARHGHWSKTLSLPLLYPYIPALRPASARTSLSGCTCRWK